MIDPSEIASKAAAEVHEKLGNGSAVIVIVGDGNMYRWSYRGPKLVIEGLLNRCPPEIIGDLWKPPAALQ